MKKKKLFICNTPYQLLMACNHTTLNRNDIVDVIISDHFSGSDFIVERINDEKIIFRKAFYVPDFNFCRRKKEWSHREHKRLLYGISIKKVFESFIYLDETYDELWIANWEEFANVTWNYIIRYNNNKAQLIYYEDGLSACFLDWRKHSRESLNKSLKRTLFEKTILNIKYTYNCFSEYHVLHPELMQFDPGCPVVRDEFALNTNSIAIREVNRIFDYSDLVDCYDKKVVFFEESFFADGINVDDEELVDFIADIVGKENIIVKIHPRSPKNRWKEKGYATNNNTTIPWEVILLNQNMSNKVMISFMCGSMVSSCLMYGISDGLISLVDLMPEDSNVIKDGYLGEIFQNIVKIFRNIDPATMFFPKNKKELALIIRKKAVL